jgi:dihydrofolate reductase
VKPRLIYSMSVSVDGFIADREGGFEWTVPSEELFGFHLAMTRELGGFLCGRRLYETMLAWETDPSLRDNEDTDAFADVWCALPKVVFSRTLDSVQGNARLADASVAEEVAAALDATDKGCWSSSGVMEKNSIGRAFSRADHRRGDWTTLRHDLPAPRQLPVELPRGQCLHDIS